MQAELAYQCRDMTGEGATWLRNRHVLLWVDIDHCVLHMLNHRSGKVADHNFPEMITSIIPVENSDSEVVISMKSRFIAYDLDKQTFRTLYDINDIGPDLRTNDCKASPEGRLWYGIMNMRVQDHNGFLCELDSDLRSQNVLQYQSIPNGMVWHDGKMYYADSGRSCIEEYIYDENSGDIKFSRTAITVPNGMGIPDGMTLDKEGNLWVAHWGGFGVYVWNPLTGKLIDKVDVPAPNVASCTFGGESGDELFITTALSGMNAEEIRQYPLSGSLFSVKTQVNGGQNHYPFRINRK